MEAVMAGLFIFVMRVTDMSMDTLRMVFVIKGKKIHAGLVGTLQALVFILAVGKALSGPLNVWTVLGYALGFGAGIVLGMLLEQKMAIGYSMIQIYSTEYGKAIASAVREKGHAATQMHGEGKDGVVSVVTCTVARKYKQIIKDIAEQIDPQSFITFEDVNLMRRGHFRF